MFDFRQVAILASFRPRFFSFPSWTMSPKVYHFIFGSNRPDKEQFSYLSSFYSSCFSTVFVSEVLVPVWLRIAEVFGTSESNSGKMVDHTQGGNRDWTQHGGGSTPFPWFKYCYNFFFDVLKSAVYSTFSILTRNSIMSTVDKTLFSISETETIHNSVTSDKTIRIFITWSQPSTFWLVVGR